MTQQVEGTEAVLVGDGPDRAAVESILSQECAESPVQLLGRLDVNDVQRLLLDYDVIVLLSDYEGLPIALMEGMACGCVPVVLRTRSGIPELVQDGVTGLIVEDRDSSFIHAIKRLRDDVELRQTLSVAAKRKINESYSESTSTAQWDELLRRVAAAAGRRKHFEVPRRISLRDGDPALEIAQRRKPQVSTATGLYRQLRIEAGKIRRSLFQQKAD
jgi:glycosyltransferase involved in cell wall biosynthesis